jgi:hypothetical protein
MANKEGIPISAGLLRALNSNKKGGLREANPLDFRSQIPGSKTDPLFKPGNYSNKPVCNAKPIKNVMFSV